MEETEIEELMFKLSEIENLVTNLETSKQTIEQSLKQTESRLQQELDSFYEQQIVLERTREDNQFLQESLKELTEQVQVDEQRSVDLTTAKKKVEADLSNALSSFRGCRKSRSEKMLKKNLYLPKKNFKMKRNETRSKVQKRESFFFIARI